MRACGLDNSFNVRRGKHGFVRRVERGIGTAGELVSVRFFAEERVSVAGYSASLKIADPLFVLACINRIRNTVLIRVEKPKQIGNIADVE